MKNSDQAHFYKIIRKLPDQIRESAELVQRIDLSLLPDSFDLVLLTGMGGSAITGDLMAAFLQNTVTIPFLVNRNYTLPGFVNKRSLVLASSYSGNTEETLAATQVAVERGATVIALSSGGKLTDFAREKNLHFIQIPDGLPPRQALGYLFFPFFYLLEQMGLVSGIQSEVSETIEVLQELLEQNDPQKSHSHNLCNTIAQKLYEKIPVIYTAAEHLAPVTVRWRNQLNENAKVLAFSNVFPELNHNEIMGWEAKRSVLECFSILLLRDSGEAARNRKRLEISRDIWRKNNIPIFEVFGKGKSKLARMFSQIYIGDWVSYYLALLYGKDPIKIGSIDTLKEALSKID